VTPAIWLGSAAPLRGIRWLDGALAAGHKLAPGAVAIAAGDTAWLELAQARAHRLGLGFAGIASDLALDYLGWAQVVAAVVRQVQATIILVDEASRPERAAEVAAIAELVDAAQLTRVIALARDGDVVHATRIGDAELELCRVRGYAVVGVRIAAPITTDEPAPTTPPRPLAYDLAALGLDARVLGHRTVSPEARDHLPDAIEDIAQYLLTHAARGVS
jgi:hypothetical protein